MLKENLVTAFKESVQPAAQAVALYSISTIIATVLMIIISVMLKIMLPQWF